MTVGTRVPPRRRLRVAACALGLTGATLFGVPLRAQTAELRGYVLNVGTVVGDGPFSEASVADFQRLRLMLAPGWGPLSLDFAYEHTLEVRSADLSGPSPVGLGSGRGTGDWLDLQGAIETGEHAAWRHRVDRAAITVALGPAIELTVGRQPISWATTLFLTPADPFSPFDPEDPFREYRAGVDAGRLRAFLGPFTDIDLVVRPADFDGERTITALGRFRSVIGGVELGGWAGALHDSPAGSASLTATVGGTAARAELVVREEADRARVRVALGLDRGFTVAGRDLYLVVEYQHDELGAGSSGDLVDVLDSPPARRGELLVLGRDAGAIQAAYSAHPLWTIDALALASLSDPSLLLGPAVSYSLSGDSTLRAGVFLGLGDETADAGGLGSEYGPVPAIGYLSLSWFF